MKNTYLIASDSHAQESVNDWPLERHNHKLLTLFRLNAPNVNTFSPYGRFWPNGHATPGSGGESPRPRLERPPPAAPGRVGSSGCPRRHIPAGDGVQSHYV